MSRDYRKLKAFEVAHALTLAVYKLRLPDDERFGLQSQMRRAAASASTNIVEGSARKTQKDYAHFLRIALGSATEARYLIELSTELSFLPADLTTPTIEHYGDLIRGLEGLLRAIEAETSQAK